jgi:hypothetical protein
VIIHGVLLIVASEKTYLSVWAGFGIYDRKGPVQYSHDCHVVQVCDSHVTTNIKRTPYSTSAEKRFDGTNH